jgi:hypothetical protein
MTANPIFDELPPLVALRSRFRLSSGPMFEVASSRLAVTALAALAFAACTHSSELALDTARSHVGLGRLDAVGEKPSDGPRHRTVEKFSGTMTKGKGCYHVGNISGGCQDWDNREALQRATAGAAGFGARRRAIRGIVVDARVKDFGVSYSIDFEVRGEVVEPATPGEAQP